MEHREIFRRNEADANRYAALCMRVAAVVAVLMWLLNLLGFFIVDPVLMNVAMPVGIVLFLLPTLLLRVWRKRIWLLKYVSMGCFLLGIGILAGALTIQLVLAWACPIILSCHYYAPRFTKFTLLGVIVCMLLAVYLGLTYLGATTARFFDITVDRTFLVVSIVRNLLGQAGIILFAVVVALACVTTAVGLVSACADYFSGLSGGRVSYRTLVCVICVFSAVVSNFGLNEIIAIASPILSVVYPPTLVLIVLALFGSRIRRDWVFRLAALGALAVSLLEVVRTYTGVELAFLDLLPLASLDFGWVLPAAVCGAVGALIPGGRTAAS